MSDILMNLADLNFAICNFSSLEQSSGRAIILTLALARESAAASVFPKC